jgi:hypothetical protein
MLRAPPLRVLDSVDALAFTDIVGHLSPEQRGRLGASATLLGTTTLLRVRTEPSLFYNRALGLGSTTAATRTELAGVVDHYRELGCSRFAILVSEGAQPRDHLPRWLEEHGFDGGRSDTKLWRPCADVPQPAPGSPRAVVTQNAERLADVFGRAYHGATNLHDWFAAPVGKQGWIHYLALDGDQVIAAAAMRIYDRIAWMGRAATLPEHRGHGAQTALVRRRLHDAREAGCLHAVSETPPHHPTRCHPSYDNLVRQGFRLTHLRRLWTRRA